jgi:OOP family OmpA-OmpF porin
MKNLYILIVLCISTSTVFGQIIDPKKAAERKATNRANSRIDQSIDKGFDKVEEGIGSLFKKKEKKEKNTQPEKVSENEQEMEKPREAGTGSSSVAGGNPPFTAYSKFDFIPGEKVLYFDNFERVEVGDFPADYNTDASGEVVTIAGKDGKWLNLTKNGTYIPENIATLPENCTIEFEVGINGEPSGNMMGFGLIFKTDANDLFADHRSGSFLYLHPAHLSSTIKVNQPGKPEIYNNQKLASWNTTNQTFVKISIWKQKSRLRVYANETKLWDLPRFFAETQPYHLAFNRDFFYDCNLYLTNFKYAVGAADTRSKLLSEGKFVTTGILFDVNAARIKPESQGILKEIGTVLTENPTVKVKVTGHTDGDGDEKSNMVLSQKRAEAVKEALSKDFGIDPARMTTEGLGEGVPVDSNATSQGKANNRRVEFTKL